MAPLFGVQWLAGIAQIGYETGEESLDRSFALGATTVSFATEASGRGEGKERACRAATKMSGDEEKEVQGCVVY